MTRDELREAVHAAIRSVAPECDPSSVAGDADFREELDIDSLDFQNVIIALHLRLNVDIPERVYPAFFTIDGAVEYLQKQLG